MDPIVSAFFVALIEALPKLFALFQAHGRDGFLVALDGTLETTRLAVDAELARKHRADEPTR